MVFDGQPRDIGSLSRGTTYPLGINNSNVILGQASTTNGEMHVFLPIHGGAVTDLNEVVPTTGFTFACAQAVNDA